MTPRQTPLPRVPGLRPLLFTACVLAFLGLALTQATTLAQDTETTDAAAATLPEGHFAPKRDRLRINLVAADDTRIAGTVMTYTVEAIHYVDADGAEQTVPWSAFEARSVERFLPRLIASSDTDGWYRAVTILAELEGGVEPAQRVLRRVERMDPDGGERITEVRAHLNKLAASERNANADPTHWPELTDEEQETLTAQLKETVEGNLTQLGLELEGTETDRFLVFTDLPDDEAEFWISVLDRMYEKLCDVFDLDEDDNIWRGKCVLIFFNAQRDYLRYNAEIYGNNVQGSAGVCYPFPTGDVQIFMFRSRERDDLAHTLVHEAAHGFLHRYKSSHIVPNWLNEGLAEYLAETLLANGGSERRVAYARQFVRARGRLDNFLTARNILGQHYGLAYDVTDMMIEENRGGYADMIEGIKDGMPADEAFEEHYGASIEEVLEFYAESRLRVTGLRLD